MDKCTKCMYDAPYNWCCKLECHEHEACNSCEAKCQKILVDCPYEIEDEDN